MEKYKVSDDDYLDLWKYFQGRADSLKESMFESVTWIIGFAAAVLGFVLAEFIDLNDSNMVINHRGLAILFCAVGIVFCIYALFLLGEFAAHIQGNWDRANECEKQVEGLTSIIRASKQGPKWGQIWHKVGLIVSLFILAFVIVGFLCATV